MKQRFSEPARKKETTYFKRLYLVLSFSVANSFSGVLERIQYPLPYVHLKDAWNGTVTGTVKLEQVKKLVFTDVLIPESGCDSLTPFAKNTVRFAC